MNDKKITPGIRPANHPKFSNPAYRDVRKGDDTPWPCPKCGAKLAVRINVNKEHANYGDIFLGCSAWFKTECDFTRTLSHAEIMRILEYKEQNKPNLQIDMF